MKTRGETEKEGWRRERSIPIPFPLNLSSQDFQAARLLTKGTIQVNEEFKNTERYRCVCWENNSLFPSFGILFIHKMKLQQMDG